MAASTIGNALTAREREILKWLSQGVSDSHIARELGISPRTVSKHLENIRGKFGVSSRTAVAVAWLSQGAKFDAGKERQ